MALSKRDQINVRLSDEAIGILYALQEWYGCSQAAVFEMLLRDRARQEAAKGFTVNPLVHRPSGAARRKLEQANASEEEA